MGTEVKYMHSEMAGAPVLSGQVGALIAVLDACLVNGFGSGTLDSLVIASSVATATRSAGHSMEVGSVALIAGITGTYSALNGERRVLAVTATTFTFDATGHANGTATGTITQKMAALSSYWAKAFSGTNLAAYQSTDPTGTQKYLRIDDTAAQESKAIGYEAMTGISAGLTGPFPTAAQLATGCFIGKSNAASSSARRWILIGDSRGFYLSIAHLSTQVSWYVTIFFGDINPTLASDPYACVLIAPAATYFAGGAAAQVADMANSEYSGSAVNGYAPRSYTGLGSAVSVKKSSPQLVSSASAAVSGSSANVTPYPNPADGGLYVGPVRCNEDLTKVYRGIYPGIWHIPQDLSTAQPFQSKDSVTGVTGLSGKTLKAVQPVSGSTTTAGVFLVDVTGPWR